MELVEVSKRMGIILVPLLLLTQTIKTISSLDYNLSLFASVFIVSVIWFHLRLKKLEEK